jgi:plasmid stabilization system protein ParE
VRAIRFHDEARLELMHEVGYYAAINLQLGERFDKAIQSAAARAAEFPDLGSPYFYGTRRVFPKKFKFSVVYLIHEQEIFVLAIAPFSRKPGYWRLRAMSAGADG